MAPKSVKGQGRVTAKPAPTPKSAPKKPAKKKAAKPAGETTSVTYIRNLHSGAGGARFDLSVVDTRIHLEPRGRRGDMRLVTEEMQTDPIYQMNLGILFEEIPITEGQEIIRKQAINQQQGTSTFDLLTNEYGAKYTQSRASVTAPFEQHGVVVGNVSTAQSGRGSRETGNIDRQVTPQDFFSEQQQVQPQFDPDVVPAGISVEQAQVFIETPREDRLALVQEWFIQQAEAEGYRASLNVQVEAPRGS